MDINQFLKLGNEAGLSGEKLLAFVEKREAQGRERQERLENERCQREEQKE